MEKNSAKRQQEVENEVYLAREKSLADASFYRFVLALYPLRRMMNQVQDRHHLADPGCVPVWTIDPILRCHFAQNIIDSTWVVLRRKFLDRFSAKIPFFCYLWAVYLIHAYTYL